jgi:hypothetical protein
VTPAVYYEQIMDKSISEDNDDSEVWVTVSARLAF